MLAREVSPKLSGGLHDGLYRALIPDVDHSLASVVGLGYLVDDGEGDTFFSAENGAPVAFVSWLGLCYRLSDLGDGSELWLGLSHRPGDLRDELWNDVEHRLGDVIVVVEGCYGGVRIDGDFDRACGCVGCDFDRHLVVVAVMSEAISFVKVGGRISRVSRSAKLFLWGWSGQSAVTWGEVEETDVPLYTAIAYCHGSRKYENASTGVKLHG